MAFARLGACHQELRILTTEFFEGSLDTFSGLSSGGDDLNLYDADEEQIQFIPLDVAEPGLSRAWGFEDGEFVDLGLSEKDEFGAYLALSDGSENRLVRDDDGNILLDDDGNALIDETYVPEFLDIASPGVVFGFEVVLPSTGPNPIDIDTICGDVTAGNATGEDLAAALQQLGLLVGDADQDGSVGFLDFLALANNFGQTDVSFSGGDFDCDGSVGFLDFLALANNFGMASASAAAAVPEPSSLLLLATGLLAITQRRRRTNS